MAEEKTKEVLELQVPTTLKHLIEALIFAAKEPLTPKQMKDIYEGEGVQAFLRQLDVEEFEAAISELNEECEKADKPYRIVQRAGGYQFATLTTYADWIGRLYKEQGRRKLSQSGIETLAIIAYKQPVTKADVESIRGVNCDYVLKTLLEKELVTVVGREHAPGRPLLYGTTREFLKHFGLNEITDLPRPREIEEILGESQFETERRMLEAQAGAEKMKEEEPDFKSRLPHIPKKKPELETTVEIKTKNNLREIKTVEHGEPEDPTRKSIPFDSNLSKKSDGDFVEIPLQSSVPEPVTEIPPAVPADGLPAAASSGAVPPASDGEHASNGHIAQRIENESVPTETPLQGSLTAEDESVVAPIDVAKPQIGQSSENYLHEAPHTLPTGDSATSVSSNKTKWQTWKEKVQGFIRKIFG